MGSYLYGAASFENVKRGKKLAKDLGYSEEEMQWIVTGGIDKQIFCSKCHNIQWITDINIVTCNRCGLSLSVSDHFSAYHQAYLGYPSE